MKYKGLAALGFWLAMNYNITAEPVKKLSAVGDVMLGRWLTAVLKDKGHEWPFLKVKDTLSNSDIAFCNLECPMSDRGKIIRKEFNFRASTDSVRSLEYAGFDIVSLANNHCLDYNLYALYDTTKTLTENGIKYCGLRNDPVVIEKDGIKMAFIGYSTVNSEEFEKRKKVTKFSVKKMQEDIANAKKENDLVVISFHWGNECTKKPAEYQRKYAQMAIDSGADLILGHHPHVLQPIEKYKDKYIIYSMGNFVFGCYNNIKKTAIFNFNYSKGKIELDEIIPVHMNGYGTKFQAIPYEGKEKQEVIDFLNGLEKKIAKNLDK